MTPPARWLAAMALCATAAHRPPPPPLAPQPAAAPTRIVFPTARTSLPGPDGRVAIRSMLLVRGRMRYGQYVWNAAGAGGGPVWIRIDLERQLLSLFRGGDEIGTAVILYGADGKPTPRGRFRILARAEHHRSSLYDAEMPYTLTLTGDGVAIHGSNVRARAATHGCIGVPAEFARRLFGQVRVGDPVLIA